MKIEKYLSKKKEQQARHELGLLWDWLGEKFKFYLVEWNADCSQIKNGGLGVRKEGKFKQALPGK